MVLSGLRSDTDGRGVLEINHGCAGNWPLGPALEHVSGVFDFSLQGLYTGLL